MPDQNNDKLNQNPSPYLESQEELSEAEVLNESRRERVDLALEQIDAEESLEGEDKRRVEQLKADSEEASQQIEKGQETPKVYEVPEPIRTGLYIAGAALGVKLAINLFFGKENLAKTLSNQKNWGKLLALSIGSALGVTQLMKYLEKHYLLNGGLKEHVKKGIDGLKSAGEEAKKQMQDGEIPEKIKGKLKQGAEWALDAANLPSKEDAILYAAETVPMRNKTLAYLRDMSFTELKEHYSRRESRQSYLGSFLEGMGYFDEKSGLLMSRMDEEYTLKAEEKRLIEFINMHKGVIEFNKTDTVREVLEKIYNQMEKPDVEKPSYGKLWIEGWADFESPDVKAKLPNTVEFIEAINEDQDSTELMSKLIKAVVLDSGNLICLNGVLFVAKEGLNIALSSANMYIEAFLAVAQGLTNETQNERAIQAGAPVILGSSLLYGGSAAFRGATKLEVLKSAAKGSVAIPKFFVWTLPKFAAWDLPQATHKYILTVPAKIQDKAMRFYLEQSYDFAARSKIFGGNAEMQALYQRGKALWHAKEAERLLGEIQNQSATQDVLKKSKEYLEQLVKPRATQAMADWHISRLQAAMQEGYWANKAAYAEIMERIDPKRSATVRADVRKDLRELMSMAGTEVDTTELAKALREVPTSKFSELDEQFEALAKETDQLKRAKGLEKLIASSEDAWKTSMQQVDAMKKAGLPESQIDEFMEVATRQMTQVQTDIIDQLKYFNTHVDELGKETIRSIQKTTSQLNRGVGFKALTRSVKSRGKLGLVVGAAVLGYESYMASEKVAEDASFQELLEISQEVGMDTLLIVVDVLAPFGITDWASVWTGQEGLPVILNSIYGEELIQAREISNLDRVTRLAFGTYSTVTDSISVLGGAVSAVGTAPAGGAGGAVVGGGIYGASNTLEAALRTAGKSPKIISAVKRAVPRIQALAKAKGGYSKLLQWLGQPQILNKVKAAAEGSSNTLKNAEGIARKGMYGALAMQGGTMIYNGVQYYYKDSESIELDERLIADSLDRANTEEPG